MAIYKRNLAGDHSIDPSAIDLLTYSNAAGSVKVSEVGRRLLPLGDGAGGFTTNATTIKVLPGAGMCLAVYNNAGAVGSVTLGLDNTQVSLAPGVADANGNCGIACPPNSYTYVACHQFNWVIASASTLLVYLIDDYTSIKLQSQNNAST